MQDVARGVLGDVVRRHGDVGERGGGFPAGLGIEIGDGELRHEAPDVLAGAELAVVVRPGRRVDVEGGAPVEIAVVPADQRGDDQRVRQVGGVRRRKDRSERRDDRGVETRPGIADRAAERVGAAQGVPVGDVGRFEQIDIERHGDVEFDFAVADLGAGRAAVEIVDVGLCRGPTAAARSPDMNPGQPLGIGADTGPRPLRPARPPGRPSRR